MKDFIATHPSSRAEVAGGALRPVIGPPVGTDKLSTGVSKRWAVTGDLCGRYVRSFGIDRRHLSQLMA